MGGDFKHSEAKSHGVIIITGEHGTVEHDTKQCCHCGRHFISIPGSGTIRGHCLRCCQITCGAPECDYCLPYEAKLEIIEGTRKPDSVSVGGSLWPS